MTTITLDDALIDKVIAVSHTQNAQEALTKIIAFYLQQHKQQLSIAELLAMPDAAAIDFEPPAWRPTFLIRLIYRELIAGH
ncbi:type II toxin-antitoxin system VapB family antitoxin [Methylobacter psychrophilus]|uniref:type II toxin-antitoxin system VapB family antitoxin n=1 Tax=Methylobacter psychrophilus TaxID=96941 RepID=UPI0021D50B24|nr:type II toxin-antitoxin system VapB family antitoxin [Methylobacter psychrophilus]